MGHFHTTEGPKVVQSWSPEPVTVSQIFHVEGEILKLPFVAIIGSSTTSSPLAVVKCHYVGHCIFEIDCISRYIYSVLF